MLPWTNNRFDGLSAFKSTSNCHFPKDVKFVLYIAQVSFGDNPSSVLGCQAFLQLLVQPTRELN